MSSYLCFVCHCTVNKEINEEIRDKYRDIVGINLYPDSHLCYICCHMLNKLWLFKSICLKRSHEYPVLYSEKGPVYLQRSDIQILILTSKPSQAAQVYIATPQQGYSENDISTQPKAGEFILLRNDIKPESEKPASEIDNGEPSYIENGEFVPENDIPEEMMAASDNLNIDDNDISQSESLEEDVLTKKKKKTKKAKKEFKRIYLSVEEQKTELEKCRKKKKYLEAEFKCYNCAMGFLFKDSYQAHMMRHEESNGEHVCQICNLRFARGDTLRSHTALHSERARCARCGGCVRVRLRRWHRCPPGTCVTNVATVADSGAGASGETSECDSCGKMFTHASGLQQHMRRVHKTTQRTYRCNVCGKVCRNTAGVRTHMLTHVNKKFHCDICQSTFSSPYTLNQHKKKHTAEQELHYCTTCKTGYTTRKSLLAHLRNAMAHKKNVVQCSVCGRACPTPRSLAAHVQAVHARSRHLACARCPARYSTRKALLAHQAAHTPRDTDKPLCHTCGDTFKTKSKLNRHLREVCQKDKLEEELSSYLN